MLAKTKNKVDITFEADFGCDKSETRNATVRRDSTWRPRIALNSFERQTKKLDVFDEKQQSFFDCSLPPVVNSTLIALHEHKRPTSDTQVNRVVCDAKKLLDLSVLRNLAGNKESSSVVRPPIKQEVAPASASMKEKDTITLDDDDDDIQVVNHRFESPSEPPIKQPMNGITLRRRIIQGSEKLAKFLHKFGDSVENTTADMGREKKNMFDDDIELDMDYIEVSKHRRRLQFYQMPDDPTYINDILDSPPAKSRRKNRSNDSSKPRKSDKRHPSPVLYSDSDDDLPLIKKSKTQKEGKETTKGSKLSPAAAVKKSAGSSKSGKRAEEPVPLTPIPHSDIFVPKKDHKLRCVNLNDFIRKNGTEMMPDKEKAERERKAREEQRKRMEEMKKRKAEEEKAANYRIPKKDSASAVSPQPSLETIQSPDLSDASKNSSPTGASDEPSRDILGTITEAMDAHAAETVKKDIDPEEMTPKAPRREKSAAMRLRDEPKVAPAVPPRFVAAEGEEQSEEEDGSADSVENTPPSDEPAFDEAESLDDDGSSPDIVDVTDEMNMKAAASAPTRSTPPCISKIPYRLHAVADAKKFSYVERSRPKGGLKEPRAIPSESDEGVTASNSDPRIPEPSKRVLSSIALDLDVEELEGGSREKTKNKKKKGVQWGVDDTREFDAEAEEERPLEVQPKKPQEEVEQTGVKMINGKAYPVFKRKTVKPTQLQPGKSCLKPSSSPLAPALSGPHTPPDTPNIDENGATSFLNIRMPEDKGKKRKLVDFSPESSIPNGMEMKKEPAGTALSSSSSSSTSHAPSDIFCLTPPEDKGKDDNDCVLPEAKVSPGMANEKKTALPSGAQKVDSSSLKRKMTEKSASTGVKSFLRPPGPAPFSRILPRISASSSISLVRPGIPGPKTPPVTSDNDKKAPMSFFNIRIPEEKGKKLRLADFVPPAGYVAPGSEKKKEEAVPVAVPAPKSDSSSPEVIAIKPGVAASTAKRQAGPISLSASLSSNSSLSPLTDSSLTKKDQMKVVPPKATTSKSMVTVNVASAGRVHTGGCGGASTSASLGSVRRPTGGNYIEKAPHIITAASGRSFYGSREAKVTRHLEARKEVLEQLSGHKTLRNGQSKEFPKRRGYPTLEEQRAEVRRARGRLTKLEMEWKNEGVQPVWLQTDRTEITFSFGHTAGLFWPIIQATDGVDPQTEKNFVEKDVLRQFNNHTHFATEKKALLGLESRLPSGMTHRERFEQALKGKRSDLPASEGRFKHRPMFSRVFQHEADDAARQRHDANWQKQRDLLSEHEARMKENAPLGVAVRECRMESRPTFRSVRDTIQFYNDDSYEDSTSYSDCDWYNNSSHVYSPYCDRAGYLCKVINSFNEEVNEKYAKELAYCSKHGLSPWRFLLSMDKAAFAASQMWLEQMPAHERVGMRIEECAGLLARKKKRDALVQNSLTLAMADYKRLSEFCELDGPHFHNIIDWLSSIFNVIKPMAQWRLRPAIERAFDELILRNGGEMGGPFKDARSIFFAEFERVRMNQVEERRGGRGWGGPPPPKRGKYRGNGRAGY